MRVLLDECVPRRIRSELREHAVLTVVEMGWTGIKNGQLLARAALEFDCFLTVDSNLQFQQSLGQLPIAVLVVRTPNNRFVTLKSMMPLVRDALEQIGRGELRVVGA
jgi:predicted nuclease of predicted toxin-antitoxin system